MEHTISQHWDIGNVVLSYAIAVTGSYCTIQLMEQWRQQEGQLGKTILLGLSSIALGGCGIWCMHFTGMRALHMTLDNGTILEVNFELGLTVLSLVFPIIGVFLGLFIASNDPFFLEIEQSRRKELLGKNLNKVSMDKMVKRDAISRRIKHVAMFSRLWFIFAGAFLAAIGVLGMHYLGMMAQRSNTSLQFDPDVVVVSAIIAFFTATAAFWILFRALTFWPFMESLRLGSALIMGVAVCGTHYTGMGAASYEFRAESFDQPTRFLVRGDSAATVASHVSILLCFWFSTFAIMVSLRKTVREVHRANKRAAVHPEGPRTTVGGAVGPNRTTKAATMAPVGWKPHYSHGATSEGVVNNQSSLGPPIPMLSQALGPESEKVDEARRVAR